MLTHTGAYPILYTLDRMREVLPSRVWIGHSGDLRDPGGLERTGIRALVHVALEEQLPQLSRELLYCHFPLVDGAGNAPGLIAVALDTTAALLGAGIPTFICCSAGMSRSPCIAAGALALAEGGDPSEWLARIARDQPHDISPALWSQITEHIRAKRQD